jgi:hypothetical protein
MTSHPEQHWNVYSDEHIFNVLKHTKEFYGPDVIIVFIPATNPNFGEDRLIYSRAAARFQHLMIIEDED